MRLKNELYTDMTVTDSEDIDLHWEDILGSLQEIFSNREIAIGFWLFITVTFSLFFKPMKKFIGLCIPVFFSRKFICLYLIFIGYFSIIIYILIKIGFWDISLLKDTIFWILFVEMPIFAKTIKNAKDNRFFTNLIKENLTFIVVLEFVLNFWTFQLLTEMIIVPVFFIIAVLFALSSMERKYVKIKKVLNVVYLFFVFSIIAKAIIGLLNNPMDLLGLNSLKTFLLPFLLLLLNLPVIYGLGLYNIYEQVFIQLKGNNSEQRKMKISLIQFSGVKLNKIFAVRYNPMQTTMISLTNKDLKENLRKLQQRLKYQVGENYMKRMNFYFIASIFGFLISFVGIIGCTSQVSLKDFLTLNFILDVQRMKEIFTYIFSCGIVVSTVLFIVSFGLKKKKYEEISNVKKIALYDLMFLIKKQNSALPDFDPIESPRELYIQYLTFVYELKTVIDINLSKYENLLAAWEFNRLIQLKCAVNSVVININISSDDFDNYSIDEFCNFYAESHENNLYQFHVKKSIEKYNEQIRCCVDEFKFMLP